MAVSGSILTKKIDDSKPLNAKSKANNTLADSLSYIGQKAVAGAAGTIEGIEKLPGLISNTLSGNGAYAARMAGTGAVDKWRRSLEEQYDPGKFLSFLGSAAEGVGQSSTFLLNAAVPYLGTATFFTGILGNSVENAASKTGDLGFKEWGYGTTVAAAEALLEAISGAGGKAAKVLAGKTAKSLGKTAVYEAVRNSIGKELISEAAGEFVEEFLGDYVDVGAQRLFDIDKNATVSLKEALYSGLVGALSGFTMAAGTSGISSAVKIAAGNKVKANGNTDTLLKMADAVANEFKSSKVGEGFGGNMNGRMNELIQNLQASTRAYQNLSPEAQNSARGSLILGEIQSAMTMIESTAAVELETEKVKANAELYAEYAKAMTDGKVQYTAEDILENKNNITTQLAVMRFAREMLTPGEVTMARDRVRTTIQNELAARGVKITEAIANGKTVEEATAEADKSPLTENTRLITDFSTTNPAGTYKVYGDKFIDVTEDTDDNGNVTGYTLYYSDSDTADKGLSVEELSSKIGNIVDANFDAVNEAMLESFAAEKTKDTAEEENAAESEKSSEKANNKKSEAQRSIRDTISNIVNRVGGNKKQTLSKEELSDRASRAAIQDKARKAVDGFDLLDVERRMAIEYMYESAAQNGISQKDADICAALMSKLNTDIGFANIENDRINGVHNWIDDHSVIVLNANKNISVTIAWALAHESAHSLERSAGYKALAKDVLKYSSKEYQQATIDTYKNANPDMSDEDIQKEVVADSLASILLQGKKLESLVAKNQSILSKAFRWITNFAKTFKNKNDVATAVINRIARQYGNALGYNRVQVISDVATVVIGKKAAVRYKNAKEQKAEVKRLTEVGIDQGVNYEGFTVNTDNTVFEEGADRTKLGYAVNNVNMIYSEAENKILLQTIIDVDKVYCAECEADVEGKVLNVTRAYISDDLQVNESADERGDIQFSIALNGKITKAQQTYLDKNKTGVTQDQLDTAKEQETRVAERLAGMSDILPEDTPGNVIRSNGSYGKSIENTTICVRTLVYNAFVEKVQKIINRPMTAMESFLVSQKLYDIAVDPQCLYCYVSLDRKAYYDYAIKYLKNRDALIEKYKKLGIDTVPKSSRLKAELKEAIQNPQTEFDLLYKNWLKDRVPTVKSWQDFAYMIRSYHNGEKQLQLSDLATNESRAKAAQDEELVRQLQMTLRYAQSASYAKAQIEYESYNGNILKMSQDLVDELNQHYGLRWYSFSDFTAAFVLENMQQFTDAALRGLKGLAYTKDINFVKIFAPTGCNINVSVFVKKDKNGNYYLDKRQSANVISEDGSTISDEMKALKEKYPNVGIVVTATDDGGVEWALNQDWSDVVIPFHIVKTGQKVADYYGWKNFSHSQKDYVVDKAKWEEARAALGRKQSDTDVMPSEHNNDKATYMRLLEERGLKPRFEAFINNPNYMKLVNECRQNGDQTEFLKAEFDYDAIDGVLDQFVEKGGYFDGWYNEGVDEDAEAKIVADDIIDGRTADEVIYGNQRYTPEEVMAKRRTNRQHKGGQFSVTDKKISPDMTDEQRYDVLKDRSISLSAVVDNSKVDEALKNIDSSKEAINQAKGTQKRNLLKKLASEFRVFKNYDSKEFDINFNFGISNFKESYEKQKRGYLTFGMMFSCFDEVINNAVGIEVHNKNSEGYKVDPTLKNVYVLASAFRNGNDIVPVKLEVKEFTDKPNILYVAIALENKKSEISTEGDVDKIQVAQSIPSLDISIADYYQIVKSRDNNFAKYFPKQFDQKSKAQLSLTDSEVLTDEKVNYFNNQYETLDDGRIKPRHIETLTNGDWSLIRKAVNRIGYDIRSISDAREVYSRYVGESGFNKDQSEAIKREYGVTEGKNLSANPDRMRRAEKVFGTTTDFKEAGYLLPDGKMLDFSEKRNGGTPHMRTQDHREISVVFNDGEVETEYYNETPYMNAFINEGNIRIMDGVGVTIGEVEPNAKQYTVLKQFIDYCLRNDGYFVVDLQNGEGYTLDSRDYEKGSNSSRIISDIKSYFKNGELPYRSDIAQFHMQYSLSPVNSVMPTSDAWKRTSTTEEARKVFPNLWNVDADESESRNPTQISSTVGTYRKIYNLLKSQNFSGTILDASSGLGYGTRAGIDEYGFNVEDIEPYPDKSYKPKYTDYSKLNKKYDAIISNAVLNVLPQDQRDALVVKMGEMLNPGGKIYINVRGKDVDTLANTKENINLSPMEWIVASTGSYQKGFTKNELVNYLKDALGDDFTVEPTNAFGGVSAIVTKNQEAVQYSLTDAQRKRDSDYMNAVISGDEATARKLVEEAANEAGYTERVYHGTQSFGFTKIDMKKSDDKYSFWTSSSPDMSASYTTTRKVRKISDAVTDEQGIDFEIVGDYIEKATAPNGKSFYISDFFGETKILDADESAKHNKSGKIMVQHREIVYGEGSKYRIVYGGKGSRGLQIKYTYETLDHFKKRAKDFMKSITNFFDNDSDGVYELALNPGNNVAEFEGNNANWDYIYVEDIDDHLSTRELAEFAYDNEYTSLHIKDIYDAGGRSRGDKPAYGDVWVVFDGKQVKSLDTAVYDDNGRIIPLSERFNRRKNEFRYSLSNGKAEYSKFSLTPEQKLENEKDRLKAKNEYNQALKEFASQTGFQDAREVDAIGTRMFEGTGGEAQQYRNRARLLKTAAAMDFIAQYPNSENALKARKKVAETLRDLAIVSLEGKNSPLYQTDINLKERLSEFRNTLKNIRINVSNIRNDLAGGWDEFRKKNAFRLRLTTSSANSYTADQVYNDFIKGNFDDLMNLNYGASMNEADLLNEIVRVLDIDPMYEMMPFEEAVNNQISEMETAINLAIAHQRVNTEGYAEGIEEGIRRAVGKYGSVYRISDANKIVRDLDGVSVNGVSVYDRSDYSPRRFLDRVIMDLNGAHDGNIEAVARVLAAEYIRQKEFEINGDTPIFGSTLMTDHPVLFNNLLNQYTKTIVNGWTKYGTDTRNTLLKGLLQIEKAAHRQDVKVLKGVNRLANAFNRLNEMTSKKKTSDVIDNAEMDAVGRMLTRILYQGNIIPKRVYQFAQAMNAIFSKSEDNMTGTELFLFRNMSEVSKETIKEILAQGENVAVDPQMVEALNGIAREIIHSYEHFGQVKISFDNSPATWQDAKPIAERGIDQANNAFMSVNDNIVKKWLTSGLINMGDPYRAAEMLENYASDPVLSKMIKDIIVSEAQATSKKIDYLKPFDEFFAENKKYKKHLSEKFHSDYFNVDMSYGEAISLYCTMKREQAQRGLTDSQIIFQRDGKALRTTKASELLKKGVDQMTDEEKLMFITQGKAELLKNLTAEDKQFIELTEDFFNNVSTKEKMAADLDYYGRYLPMEDYYYPIAREQSSFNDNITDASKIAGQFVTYTNLSFNKATQKGAAKELYIKNVWDVITNHAEGLSKYTTMWRPLTNFNYIWNDNVSEETGIHKSMKKAYNDNVWDGTGEYFRKLFNDIQGIRDSKKPLDTLVNKIRGGAVVFGLGFNPKVWLTQLTSLIACMDTLSPGAYIRGMAMYSPKNDEQMDKHSLYAKVRDYDTEVVKAQGVIDKVGEAGQLTMKPIGWFDRQVVRMLWGVCQVQAKQQKGLAIGSEENMVEAGKLLDDAIMRNQQTAGAGTRSALMRGSELTKSLTMFTADAMKQFSSFAEAVGKFNRASRDVKNGVEGAAAVKAAAGRQLIKTACAITGVATMMAVIASMFRHLYDKDRKKKANGEEMSVVEDIATESVGNVIGIIPIVSQIYGYITDGYDLNDYTLDAVNDTLKYFTNITGDVIDAAKGEKIDGTTIAKDVRDTIYGIGLAAGIPTRNMNNVLTALMKILPGDTEWSYKYAFKNPSYRKELDQAIANGDDSLATLVMKTWVEREKTGGSGEEIGRLLELYKQGYNIFGNNIPDKITVNGEEKQLKAKDIKSITNIMTAAEDNLAALISKGIFSKVSDETEARAIRNYYTYNMDIAKNKIGADRTKYGTLSELYGAESVALVRAIASTSEIPEGKTKKQYVIETLDSLGLTDDIYKYIAGYTTDYAEEQLKQQIYNYTNDPEIRRQMLTSLGIEA